MTFLSSTLSFVRTRALRRSIIKTVTLALSLSLILDACGNTEELPPADPNMGLNLGNGVGVNPNGSPTGSPTGNQMGGAVGLLIDTTQPSTSHCTVAFIGPIHVLTAAHCVQRGANPARYQVSAYSPVVQPLSGVPVARLDLHPNWTGDTTLVTQHLYAITGTGSGEPPLQTTPLYDLAVLTLSAPVQGALELRSGPLPVVGDRATFTSVYFVAGLNGESRGSEPLAATDVRASSFTTLIPSVTQGTMGGAAAVISASSVTGSGELLVGIFAGGIANLGAVFTRVDIHRQFISDVLSGSPTGNYTVDHSSPGGPGPGPGTFSCAEMSDNFCDYACEGDVDCEVPEQVKLAAFGTPCTASAECLSGVCLMFDEQNTRCSAYCGGQQGSCPTGFECRPAISGNLVCGTPLTVEGELPPPPALNYFGANCMNDAQCSTNACITHNDEKWCSQRCRQNSDCPLSYICGTVMSGRACIPPPNSRPPEGSTTPPEGSTTPPEGSATPPEGNTTPPPP